MSGLKSSFNQWSLNKRIDLIYSNSFAANIATIFLSFLLVLAVNKSIPSNILWTWFSIISFIASCRLILAYYYQNKNKSISIENWAIIYTVSSILIGTAWAGAAYFYYLTEKAAIKSLVVMLLIGIIASAMIVLTASMRIFYGHIIPIFSGLTTAIIISGESYAFHMVAGFIAYLVFISAAGKNTNKHLTESLQLQYENQKLVLSLEEEINVRKNATNALEGHREKLEGLVEERTSQLLKTNEALTEEIKIRKKVEESLKHLAYHDELTKLPNRLLFIDRLGHALVRCKRHKTNVSIMFVDLNRFKKINDTFGHAAGDHVLISVANRLRKTLRTEDTISRFGGDEFVIIIEHEDQDNIEVLSEKIQELISKPIPYIDKSLSISCSIGISKYPDDGGTIDLLLDKADAAMYLAKSGN